MRGGLSFTALRYPRPAPIPAVPASTFNHSGGARSHPTGNAEKAQWPLDACRQPGRQATVARRNSDRRNSPWWEVARLGQAL